MAIRDELVAQGVKFLNHPKVQDTPMSQKVSFLEKKGLTAEEVSECMRKVKEAASSASASSTTATSGGSGTIKRSDKSETGVMNHVVSHNGTIYLAGQVCNDPTKDFKGQLEEVLGNVDRLLTSRGSSKSKLLHCTVFLTDATTQFDAMNEVYKDWVDSENLPTRSTVEAKLVDPKYLVEIVATAAV